MRFLASNYLMNTLEVKERHNNTLDVKQCVGRWIDGASYNTSLHK